jgi:hypothetical protein
MNASMHLPAVGRPFPAEDGRELSLGQEALWFIQELEPDSSAYNVAAALNLHFAVDAEAMAQAVRRVVSGHRVLNCVFGSVDGEVRRHAGDAAALDDAFAVHEVAGDEQAVREFAVRVARRPFRLDRHVPIRCALLRRVGDPDVLVVAAHHIAVDNVSQRLIFREILSGYAAALRDAAHTCADDGAAFDAFVAEQRAFLASPRAAAAREYWRGELTAAASGADLPTDLPRPATYRFAGAEVEMDLPQDLLDAVQTAAAQLNTTVFAYLFAVFQLLLHTFSGNSDFTVGYNASLRFGARRREAIGFFVNTLPFHAHVDPDAPFDDLLQRTRTKLWQAQVYRAYPFALMPRLIDARRDPSRVGLIPVMFVIAADDRADPEAAAPAPGRRVRHAGLTVSDFSMPQQLGQVDLTLQISLRRSGTTAALKYNTSLYTDATARGLARDFSTLLRSVVGGALDHDHHDHDHADQPKARAR